MRWLLPPILVVALLLAMAVLSRVWPAPRLLAQPWQFIGLVPLMAGLVLPLSVNRRFRQVDTNIHTFRDPDLLVVDGVFGYTRNPIYLGFALLLLGAALLFNVAAVLLPVVIYVLVADLWYIRHEEARMADRFGPAYDDYRRRVRRWL